MEQSNLQDIAKEILALLEERNTTNTESIDNAIIQNMANISIIAEEKMQQGEDPTKILEEIYSILDKETLLQANCFSFLYYLTHIKTALNRILNASE